jgi:endonuclease YncB( thermonuclease family)
MLSGMVAGNNKKAPRLGAFFLCLWLVNVPVFGDVCHSGQVAETVQIRQVYDGDTVELSDGRKVRLLGINTPEINHEQGDDEPLAREARQALLRLLGDAASVGLVYGPQRSDHYGRLLAQLIVDGRIDVQQRLLEQGLAMAIVITPNIQDLHCYGLAEEKARQRQVGVWGLDYYRPLAVDHRPPRRGGFRLLQGVVRHVGMSKAYVWFDLQHGVGLRLKKTDMDYFSDKDWQSWRGQKIEARGWLYKIRSQQKGDAWRMNITHPQNLVRLAGTDS